MTTKIMLLRGAALATAIFAGACGGGGDDAPPPPPPANVAPMAALTVSAATAREGETVRLDAGASTDPDGDPLSFGFTQVAGPTAVLASSLGSATDATLPEVDADAVLTFEVQVTDGRGGSDTARVDVTVSANQAPVAAISAPTQAGTLRFETTEVVLSAAASTDPEGDALSYSYRFLPELGVDISGETGPELRFVAPRVDADTTVAVIVTVTDSFGDSDEERVEITVLDNTPPTISATPREARVDEGETAVVDVVSTIGDRAALAGSAVLEVVQIAGPEVEVDVSGFDAQGVGGAISFDAPEVEADTVVSLDLRLGDGIDVVTERVDVTVGNVVLEPDAGLGLSREATLTVGRPVADALVFDNDDLLLVVENPDRDPDDGSFDAVGAVSLERARVATGGEGFIGPSQLIADFGNTVPNAVESGAVSEVIRVTDSGLTFNDIAIGGVGGAASTQLSTVGVLSVPGACAAVESFQETSAGPILLVGRADGLSLFTYSVSGTGIDFSSIRELDTVTNGRSYCTLSRPTGTNFGGSNTVGLLAFDGVGVALTRFSLTDDGGGGVTLRERETLTEFDGLPVSPTGAPLVFVDGDSKEGSTNTLAVVLSDGAREGAHALLRFRLGQFDDTLIETDIASWPLGVPGEVVFESLDPMDGTGRSRDSLLVSLPATPFLLSVPDVGFSNDDRVFSVSYSEVGIGFDGIAESSVGSVGGSADSLDNSLVMFDADTGEVVRFEVANP